MLLSDFIKPHIFTIGNHTKSLDDSTKKTNRRNQTIRVLVSPMTLNYQVRLLLLLHFPHLHYRSANADLVRIKIKTINAIYRIIINVILIFIKSNIDSFYS